MVQRTAYEQRSALDALETFLTNRGWTNITYTDGFQPELAVTNPQVVVTLPPRSIKELQLGRGDDKLFRQSLLITAYMENERRAEGIVDDIMDFMDLECIIINDHNDNYLGFMQCPDSELIQGQVFQPSMSAPKLSRWRGSVTGPFESFYPG